MSKGIKVVLGLGLGLVLAVALFTSGIALGWALPQFQNKSPITELPEVRQAPSESAQADSPTSPPFNPEDQEALFAPFWEAWEIVHEEFVDQPVDDITLMRGAIRGMLSALGDSHTSYMDPDEYTQANLPLDGSYEGIGAWVDTDSEYLTIISPMPGSPAEEAGLEPGDEVLAVNGEDMTGVDGNLVIREVLGPAGTEVTLTIRREGEEELFDVVITRAQITIPSVQSEMLENDIGYIQLFTFGAQTTPDFQNQIAELLDQGARGLILDLRNNGGGYLSTSVEIASEFIADGLILTERYGDGNEDPHYALSGGQATDIPLIVIVNGGTASASEIVAGAIQDHDRALLIGETTFGKGSVQNWVPLEDEQGAVRVTIARWYTPNDRQIHEVGLEPDVEVLITEEDIEAESDPQLDTAIELLEEQIGN